MGKYTREQLIDAFQKWNKGIIDITKKNTNGNQHTKMFAEDQVNQLLEFVSEPKQENKFLTSKEARKNTKRANEKLNVFFGSIERASLEGLSKIGIIGHELKAREINIIESNGFHITHENKNTITIRW